MTREDQFTLSTLQAFTPCDFEQYRDRGETFRLKMVAAVLGALSLPDCWMVDSELRQEWGGLHSVHLRLSHVAAPLIRIDLLGPSHESPFWYGRLWFEQGTSVAWFYCREHFDPESLNAMLAQVSAYIHSGFDEPGSLVTALRRGRGAV